MYDQVTEMEALRRRLENALKEYNEYNPTMNLVLFPDVIRHVCRIARAVSSSAGHALLVGLGGSGKASLSRLAAYLCDQSLYRINVSPTYSLLDFKDDVKVSELWPRLNPQAEQTLVTLYPFPLHCLTSHIADHVH